MTNQQDPLLHEIAALVSHSLEGDLSPEQFERFRDLLRSSSQARAYYYQLLSIHATLQEAESILMLQDAADASSYQDALNAFLVEEKNAPAVEVPIPEQVREVVHKVHYEKRPRQISRSTLVTLVLSTAAILMIVLLLRFGPALGMEVATVTNSLDAVLAGGSSAETGTRLSNSDDSMWLQKGTIEITFDYGARVVIEAPAHFQLNSAENITLYTGRLFAHVPERSKGFMVETPSSRVIDLGTEFGVKVDFDGTSDVYMMKGKASVFSGSKGSTGAGQILIEGDARRVDTQGQIARIPMKENEFARGFLSEKAGLWRGQPVDLADMVGGGNGLGTGRVENAIDPVTGRMAPWEIAFERTGTGQYMSVNDSVLIDGVFVPDGGDGPIRVTSTGIPWQAPDTSGGLKYMIANTLHVPADLAEFKDYAGSDPKEDVILRKASEKNIALRPLSIMGSSALPDPAASSLFMHANAGISFDLEQCRKMLPEVEIAKFTSTFGIGDITDPSALLDVWVLVDGRPRFHRQQVTATEVLEIDVDLSNGGRFLTLVVTDGAEQRSYGYDWGLFLNPKLEVE